MEKTLKEPACAPCVWLEGPHLLEKWAKFINSMENEERQDYNITVPLVQQTFGDEIASLSDVEMERKEKKKKKKTKKRKNSKINENAEYKEVGGRKKTKIGSSSVKLRKTRSSILQDIEESSSEFSSKPSKLYEIEDVLVEGVWADVKTEYYFVKWKGFGYESNSFVDLCDATDQLKEWWQKERLLRYPLIPREEYLVTSLNRKQLLGTSEKKRNYMNDPTLRQPILQLLQEWTDSDQNSNLL